MKPDLVVIGAGPAGLSAAVRAANHGAQVMVIDEHPWPGGRLLGQLHEHGSGGWWNGQAIANRLAAAAETAGVTMCLETSVWHLAPGWRVGYHGPESGYLDTPAVLVAAGAAQSPLAMPGWTLPGVLQVGAVQMLVNRHRVLPGKRVLVIGVDILALTVARQLQLAGVEVAGIVLPPSGGLTRHLGGPLEAMTRMAHLSHLAPSWVLRWAGALGRQGDTLVRIGTRLYPTGGVRVWGIPLWLRRRALEIVGAEEVEAVRVADVTAEGEPVAGSEQLVPVDAVCISGGLHPLTELAAVAGCPLAYIPSLGGHVPLTGPEGQTPMPGLFLAGNITGVEAATVAMLQGELAAVGALQHLGLISPTEGAAQAGELGSKIDETRRTADVQFHPQVADGRAELARKWAAFNFATGSGGT